MARQKQIRVSIFKRAGRDVWYMQYRHPVTGRKVVQTTEQTSKRDALKAAGKWEDELREKREKKHGNIPWSDFRRRYEDEEVAGLAETTDRKIASVLNSVESILSPQRLADLDDEAISIYQKALREDQRSENTIKSHLAHLRAALSWAKRQKLISEIPEMPRTQRAKSTRVMKGRPITTEEFERMLAKIEAGLLSDGEEKKPKREPKRKRSEKAVADEKVRLAKRAAEIAPSWRRLLLGLWWSGLRLKESLDLHWTDERHLCVDFSSKYPLLRIPAEKEKGHKDRLLPLAPEFAKFLLETPQAQRVGFVFDPRPQRIDKNTGGRLSDQQVGHMITRIGKAAGVKVNVVKGKAKFASAHDLRRSFGARWAPRVMPQVLQELMRHESIETTMLFYVGRNAQATADVLWQAHNADKAAQAMGDTLGDTRQPIEENSL